MKYLLLLFISFILTWTSHAQSFEVVGAKGAHIGEIGQNIQVPIKIKNLSNSPLQVIIKRIDQVIGTSQSSYFCWGEECFDSEIDQLPLSKRIDAKASNDDFTSILESGLVAGISTVKYLIYNRDNPSDAVEYEINYTVEEDLGNDLLFISPQISINEVYPNPVKDFAIFDYNLQDEDVEAKIVMHNVLGSIVGEYELNYLETKLKIVTENLNPGVYFYTLYLDNDGLMTKKLVIRK